ncbi:MAG: bifunctional hydroxymethylpyrimidine kinase/phosphomethylpyrimidine kinase [Proteobacteria bacterium]|nr:bifunctional hydroxymethylpyrimidine kinase/phosphomethylpyrimidine kinase [Pseudomonadota bacterium]
MDVIATVTTSRNVTLSIAGSDPSGGAGIQCDIKTASSIGSHICTVITCLTAQDSGKVHQIIPQDPQFIQKQIALILDDIAIDVIKIGMVGNAQIIQALDEILTKKAQNIPVILDPILISTGGNPLLEERALNCFKTQLIPHSFLITPNAIEAGLLCGIKISDVNDMEMAAKELIKLGASNVLIKGGHLNESADEITHLLVKQDGSKQIFTNERLKIGEIRGTGCALSTAISCFLGKGYSIEESISQANQLIYQAIKNSQKLGKTNRFLGTVNKGIEY